MTRSTLLPFATDSAGPGLELMTRLGPWSGLSSSVILPTSRPASWSVLVASLRPMPTTLGTPTSSGPAETWMTTVSPSGTLAPSPGSCAMTVPTAPSSVTVSTSALRPTLSSLATAASSSLPTTLGTVTCTTSSPWLASQANHPRRAIGMSRRAAMSHPRPAPRRRCWATGIDAVSGSVRGVGSARGATTGSAVVAASRRSVATGLIGLPAR